MLRSKRRQTFRASQNKPFYSHEAWCILMEDNSPIRGGAEFQVSSTWGTAIETQGQDGREHGKPHTILPQNCKVGGDGSLPISGKETRTRTISNFTQS